MYFLWVFFFPLTVNKRLADLSESYISVHQAFICCFTFGFVPLACSALSPENTHLPVPSSHTLNHPKQ